MNVKHNCTVPHRYVCNIGVAGVAAAYYLYSLSLHNHIQGKLGPVQLPPLLTFNLWNSRPEPGWISQKQIGNGGNYKRLFHHQCNDDDI